MAEYVTKDMTENARNANLAEYFRTSGYSTKKHGNELYVEEVPGFCVNVSTNSWYSHYEGFGGNNPIDCLTKVFKKDFVTAVTELSGRAAGFSPPFSISKHDRTKFKKELEMPERGENYKRIYAYLIQSRGIPQETINELVHQKLLYQDKNGNTVFIHKNEQGEIIGGEIQGTVTNVRFKGMATGTGDSLFQFSIGTPKKAYAFESSVDLLSFYSMADKSKLQDVMLVSMGGLKPVALKSLTDKGIEIISCVDNDEKGKKFTITNGFKSYINILEKNGVKDWNELLQKIKNIRQAKTNENFNNPNNQNDTKINETGKNGISSADYKKTQDEKSENSVAVEKSEQTEKRNFHKRR